MDIPLLTLLGYGITIFAGLVAILNEFKTKSLKIATMSCLAILIGVLLFAIPLALKYS